MAPRPTRRRRSRTNARLDLAAIEIVGALLAPDIVVRIAAFDASEQTEASYGIPPGLRVRDEIARYFRIGEALWSRFEAARGASIAASERFVLELLRQCFGFETIAEHAPVRMGERVFPIRHAALASRVPIVIAPAADEDARRSGVDESLVQFADGARRRSATLLLQEYLNAHQSALWGLATDGRTLRLMRDNISLTRPAWIEADLAKIFTEGLFPDFTALWLLIHQSRFGAAGAAIADCPLERWRERGRTEGTAARDKLRLGVKAALEELGQGFIEHPTNAALIQALRAGELTPQTYFEQLLRLVYRLIFLFAAEDRNLLHPEDAPAAARRVYAQGYGIGRLRERCMRRTAWDQHSDAFEGLKATFTALSRGEPRLGLPPLGGLFARGQTPQLTASRIANRRLLAAIWRLAWFRPDPSQPLTRVNWRDMETEELGSVYEGLLELTPRASADARTFAFADGLETRGHERKKTGSYYTPEALVKLLLDATLDPVLDAAEARNPADPGAAILKLSILDPACGSGHFLLGAARRAAARIARLRSPGAPSQIEFQHALREVVAHCIHGVDRNPLAVELCKVALWIEALEPGKPLTFLDARIRCGDSLIGVFDYAMLKDGIPDEAYKPLTGDDKDAARAWAKLNRGQRDGKAKDGMLAEVRPPAALLDAARALAAMPEDTLEQIAAKERALARLHAGSWLHLKAACDLYVAAFFAPKTAPPPTAVGLATATMPLTDHVWRAAAGHQIHSRLFSEADRIAHAVHAFHWPLEFPDVLARGGFDAVIGNPPWERIKLQEQEFFAAPAPGIANAPNAAARGELIRALAKAEDGSPERRLHDDFVFAKRAAEAGSEFARNSGRFPLTGTGDVNTYALFAELFSRLARAAPTSGPVRSIAQAIMDRPSRHDPPPGRAGVIVPTGIATDSSTSAFFGDLVGSARLVRLYDFQTGLGFFDRIGHARYKFCLLTVLGPGGRATKPAEFAFFIRQASELDEAERFFSLSAEQIVRINPNTRTAPVFRSRADAALTAGIYDRVPVLIEERPKEDGGNVNPWGVTFQTLFHMSIDSGLFTTAGQLADRGWTRDGTDWVHEGADGLERRVPLYEAKMIHHFDHRWATYPADSAGDDDARDVTQAEKRDLAFEPEPRYWVPEDEVTLRAARVPSRLKSAWRRRDKDPDACARVLAEWLAGAFPKIEGRPLAEEDLRAIFGRNLDWRAILGKPFAQWLAVGRGEDIQAETPLTEDDLDVLRDRASDPVDLAWALIKRRQPRWLMGWRDITNATNERTVIGAAFPKVGVGNNLPVWYVGQLISAPEAAALVGLMSSLVLDFTARHKVGGTHLNFFIAQQLPVLAPSAFTGADLDFITPRVLELTYTSHAMRPWAEDLGHHGPPFAWDEERRAQLRAELDAFFAKKYGLTRGELVYALDPAKAKGPDYPSETFRVLQKNELARFGEYRTERLVLAAFDRLTGA
jgi:hypothetical protein